MAADKKPTGGLRLVRDAIEKAAAAPKVGRRPFGSEIEEPELPLLPPGCPVKPLGKLGQVCYFLDEQGQLVGLDPQKIGKNHIRNLFGRRSELCDEYWPRLGDDGKPKGHGQWHPEKAGDLLMKAAAFEGLFDPQGRVRGRGAHRGRRGELVLHCGDALYVAAADGSASGYHEPGKLDGYVYPTAPAIPRPDPGEPGTAPAEKLLALLRTWNWERPIEDPMFLLGLIGAMMIGGWLEWRPHAWMTGSRATGKSTLQKALEYLFDGAALHTHDASEAALRQILKQQTLPVFFDELEAEEDSRRGAAIVKLARLASSGAVVFRGGQDHQGHEFTVRSCFLFSSILVPPMLAQDRSRLALLELHELPADAVPPVLDQGELRQWGREFKKRMADQFHRFEETLNAYRKALARHGHGGRTQDQFGVLLACADLLLYDFVPDAELLEEWGARLAIDKLAEKVGERADEQEAVEFLATSILQAGRGSDEPQPIVRHIEAALGADADRARERLENFGLRVGCLRETPSGGRGLGPLVAGQPVYLAVANTHEGLARIFAPTRWNRIWQQPFGRVSGSVKRVKVRFAGAGLWATCIPLAAILEQGPES